MRVLEDRNWTLFSPDEAPGLHDAYGDSFNALYEAYEARGKGKATIPAQKLWYAIMETQIETGGPFMCYKDTVNSTHNLLYLRNCHTHLRNVLRREIQSETSRCHQVLQSLYRDYGVLIPARSCSL